MKKKIYNNNNLNVIIMKKNLFYAVVAIGMLASCAENEYVGEVSPNPDSSSEKAIVFGSGTQTFTRADYTGSDAADKLQNNFVVEGWKDDGTTKETVFDYYNVNWKASTANTTTSNTNDWEYVAQTKNSTFGPKGEQTIKYWDYSAMEYDFIAYSKGTATAVYAAGNYDENVNVLISDIDRSKINGADTNADGVIDEGAYTIKGTAEQLAKVYIADMVTAYRADDAYRNVVQFKFRSLSAKVRIALYEIVPGYSVQDVVFYTDASTAATDSKAYLYTTGTDVFNNAGTYTVYYPNTGYAKSPNGASPDTDYNKAHLAFKAESGETGTATKMAFGAFDADTYVTKDDQESDATGKLYIGRASNEATYAGTGEHYTTVIPNETGAVLNLKVDYTLISTDGSGETIKVTGATAKVPAVYAQWKSGYAYTYIFKISQNGDGYTNPSVGPEGLYPITFDALVLNSEVDGIQETITTVADPSITTYSKGKVVTENNEYTRNTNIYIVVGNGVDLTAYSNANMYKVTIEDDAAQTINEASVANVLKNGTKSGNTWTVTDANNKSMSATIVGLTDISEIPAEDAPDGNAITIDGVVFNTSTSGTYAFEYTDGTTGNKFYKIIIIQ